MQEMTVIDWLKAYRPNSPIYTADAFPLIDTETLGAGVRLLGASIVAQYDDIAVESAIDILTTSLAVVANAHGLPSFIIKAGASRNGKAWSILIRRMDRDQSDGETRTLEMTEPRIEASFIKNMAPPATSLIELWDASQSTHPFLLRLSDEEIGAVADPIRRSLSGRVDIDDLINITASATFLILALEHTKSPDAVRFISELQHSGRALGDWALFVSEDGDFTKLVTELEESLRTRTPETAA